MKEQKIQTFVSIVKHYFDQFATDELIVDTPYLFEGDQPDLFDYTGVIGISGVMQGAVYVSASKELLQVVLKDLNEKEMSDSMLVDLVGEIANTITGNARSEFGPEFHISIPLVFKGPTQSVVLPKGNRSFVIPIIWQKQVGEIVVCLKGENE